MLGQGQQNRAGVGFGGGLRLFAAGCFFCGTTVSPPVGSTVAFFVARFFGAAFSAAAGSTVAFFVLRVLGAADNSSVDFLVARFFGAGLVSADSAVISASFFLFSLSLMQISLNQSIVFFSI